LKKLFITFYEFTKQNYNNRKEFLDNHNVYDYLFNNKGFVLIIVLIISSMLIIASSEFLLNAQININYIKKFKDETQAEILAEAGFNVAKLILEADKKGQGGGMIKSANSDKNIDCYDDLWAMDFPEIDLENGSVKIEIRDEQSKINLNAVSTEFVEKTPYYNMLSRFFANIGFPVDLSDCVADWTDIDNNRFPYGAETYDYYSILPRPYAAKNAPFDSIDELLMVKGFTPEIFYGFGGGNYGKEEDLVDSNTGISSFSLDDITLPDEKSTTGENSDEESKDNKESEIAEIKVGKEKSRKLSNYLRVYGDPANYLSTSNKININTAPFRVILTLTEDMTEDTATQIIKRRMATPFKNSQEVSEFITDQNTIKNIISVNSEIFSIRTTGMVSKNKVVFNYIYNRDSKKTYYFSIQ